MASDKSVTWDEFTDFCKKLYNILDDAVDTACNDKNDDSIIDNIAYSYAKDYASELLDTLGITIVMRPFTIYLDSTVAALTE